MRAAVRVAAALRPLRRGTASRGRPREAHHPQPPPGPAGRPGRAYGAASASPSGRGGGGAGGPWARLGWGVGSAALAAGSVALGGAAGATWVHGGDGERAAFAAFDAAAPFLRLLDAEAAHRLAVWAAARGLVPRDSKPGDPALGVMLWGRHFANPLGLAAGFDKDAECMAGMLGMGFGFVEVGSVTPKPQPGNPTPRLFRLYCLDSPELAVINRYGFNSGGHDAALANVVQWRASGGRPPCPTCPEGKLGVNLGRNKTSPSELEDYAAGVRKFAEHADYLVVNISCPNQRGVRARGHGRRALEALVGGAQAALREAVPDAAKRPPLLVKVSPDLTPEDQRDVAAVALKLAVDGLIVANTSVQRPPEIQFCANSHEPGGLSGTPLMEPSTRLLHDMYALTKGQVPLVGVGGVASGADAYRKIRAGASLVQLYTALTVLGPGLVPRIKEELAERLRADGFSSVAEAVGADHRR